MTMEDKRMVFNRALSVCFGKTSLRAKKITEKFLGQKQLRSNQYQAESGP